MEVYVKLRKNSTFLLLIIFSILLSSCSQLPFNPMAYNKKPNTDIGGPDVEEPTDPDTGVPTDPENDPFKDPEYSDPNKHFSASKFDPWEIRSSFAGNNSPTFSFANGSWVGGNASKNEYKKGGPNSSGGGYSITGVTYYLYKDKNPLFSPSSSYNNGEHGERMKRFYFYRFTGKGGGIQWLDNMLIAVDRYTKLVFAFAIPTKYNHVLGQKVPVAWGAVDTRVNNGKYKFYEYDPVGIVKENGSIELYSWYKSAMGSGNYNPIIGSPDREVATYGKAGRSPYYTLASATTGDDFKDIAKSKEYLFRTATAGRSDILDAFSFSMDAKTLTHREERWRGKGTKEFNYTHSKTINKHKAIYSSSWGSTITVNIRDNGKEVYIDEYKYKGRIDFNDPGPRFPDRVKAKTFRGSGYTYTFNYNGSEIKLSNGKTYYLTWRDNGNYAVYVHNYIAKNHWGVNIRDHNGVVDGRITWTLTSWASPSTTPPTDAWYSPANLVE